ncbi:molybdate ABC transporter substrate-binding protein [Thermosulfurimonas sp. F29]|uniref:molybdate ABC transporter substrate-binding protein n=1 Tax=Thermosulfurimonas sp. F29 TaxID=2867247 RepID=UPI001C829831|nr:molybdate ABC transporter substrate-binding protein [Thermosulfurimonas sp. F29]MBX6421991.1 molybdate ABC transporter substrate-binding protein [Thermosulfurimonas sp. F29]
MRIVLALLLILILGWSEAVFGARILIFAGAASRPPTEEVAQAFERKTGVKVDLVFGGSGYVLSQMLLSRKGDLYFPGSSDYMELAKKKGAVIPETERVVAYLVPAIIVRRGNPRGIHSLRDLLRPGLRVAIANPEGVCVGAYAVEIVEKNFSAEEKEAFRRNLVNYTGSCAKTAAAVLLGAVDAVLGWRVFAYWNPEKLEVVPLKPEEIVRVGYLPIAVSRFTRHRDLAERFIRFLLSSEGKAIFRRYHYFMSREEAFAWIGAEKPVGGTYQVPPEWLGVKNP